MYISVSFKQVRPLLYSGHQFGKDIVKMNKILLQNRNKFRSLCNNASALHNARNMSSDPIVFVDGVRTPFLASLTDFESMMPHELLSQAFTGLLSRTGVSPAQVDYLCAGTVQQEVRTSNITKEAAFDAGFPLGIPGHTVTMACISANQDVTTCMGLLATGQSEDCFAGGEEFCSDQTIR